MVSRTKLQNYHVTYDIMQVLALLKSDRETLRQQANLRGSTGTSLASSSPNPPEQFAAAESPQKPAGRQPSRRFRDRLREMTRGAIFLLARRNRIAASETQDNTPLADQFNDAGKTAVANKRPLECACNIYDWVIGEIQTAAQKGVHFIAVDESWNLREILSNPDHRDPIHYAPKLGCAAEYIFAADRLVNAAQEFSDDEYIRGVRGQDSRIHWYHSKNEPPRLSVN